MNKGLFTAILLILSLCASLLGGCTAISSSPGTVSGTGTIGKLQVYVTDAPPKDVTVIEIQAGSIEIHKSDAGEGEWITVVENPPAFDLVQLTGVNMLLGTANVTSGNYTQVRIGITSVMVTINGEQKSAKVPSDKLKLVGTFEVQEGQATSISLDFDAAKSIVVQGNGEILLKPVIKLVTTKPGKQLDGPITTPEPKDKGKPVTDNSTATENTTDTSPGKSGERGKSK